MSICCVDIETYSSADLMKSGVYGYASAPDFDVLLFGYSLDGGPVKVMTGAELKSAGSLIRILTDPSITKSAFNANFERTCLSAYLGVELPPEQWSCTMVWAMTLGLPGNLAQVAEVLQLDQKKMTAGKTLIEFFSKPCRPTTKNGKRTRNLPRHDPEKWDLFKKYNAQDVRTEMAIRDKLEAFPILQEEQALWCLDQRINDRGIRIDTVLVDHAITCNAQHVMELEEEASRLTGLDNPKSVSQLKGWLEDNEGIQVDSLDKKAIKGLIGQTESDLTQRVLELRQELSKSSIAKYEAMQNAVGPDGRVRGLLQFYGANRTGRWAGRLVQVQNLPQNHLKQLDEARELLRVGEYEALGLIFDSVPSVLSELIRTAFVPSPGCQFVVADFSAIEARVIAWLAGEEWRQEVVRTHGKIYEASAAQMFKVPIESIKKGDPLRQKGKVSELALGYQGGPNALKTMGALEMGVPEEELPKLVKMWRNANPMIVKFWSDVEEAALAAVADLQPTKIQFGIQFFVQDNKLFIQMPSGRRLCYIRPRVATNRFGNQSLAYDGMNQTTRKWEQAETYGGKLVENIVQAVARDCLAESMMRLDAAGFKIVMHVHDEVVLDSPIEDTDALKRAADIMGQPISWAPGLLLRADGYSCPYYQKD